MNMGSINNNEINNNNKINVIRNTGIKESINIIIIILKITKYTLLYIKINIVNNIMKIVNINNQNKYKSAFSLIELSIVLIIIGLLVAGVTGGQSLINSAKQRAFINEIKDYEKAIWTFKAARDRYPGDVKNYGTFGYRSNYTSPTSTSTSYARPGYQYKKEDFSAPYNAGSFIPDAYTAPFIDLYTEGIIDFKPTGNGLGAGYPYSRVFKKVYFYPFYSGSSSGYSGTPTETSAFWTGIRNNGSIQEFFAYYYDGYSETKGFDPKMLKSIDEKIDDGKFNNGRVRSGCYGSKSFENNTYHDAISNNKKCGIVDYAI